MHIKGTYIQPIYTYLNTHEHYKLLLYKHRLVPMSKQILCIVAIDINVWQRVTIIKVL